MARAKKILIVKGDSLDETFMLTRKTVTTQTTSVVQETDENAEIINPLRRTDPMVTHSVEEEFHAVGVQSKEPAKVIVLETTDGITKDGLAKREHDNRRPQPMRIDEFVRPGGAKVIDESKLF